MRTVFSTGIAMLSAIALTGCGGGTSGNSADATTSATGGGSGGGGLLSSGWKGDEACTTLSKETVAKIAGMEVTETKLDGVFTTKDTPSNVSSCYYTLRNGGIVAILTKESPDSDNTAESMKSMHDETAAMMGPAEDVGGVGKSAFWLPKVRQLNVFLGKTRYFNVTVPADLGGKDPKAVALAIAAELD